MITLVPGSGRLPAHSRYRAVRPVSGAVSTVRNASRPDGS